MNSTMVAVGMALTGHPPHRSVRAALLHTAPTLDNNGPTYPAPLTVRQTIHATWSERRTVRVPALCPVQ